MPPMPYAGSRSLRWANTSPVRVTREAEEFTVENDVMIVTFSTRGGRITGVTLKDYTGHVPRGKRDQLIELMDPASARFDLSFHVKNGLNNVKVNTMDYVFRAQPEQVEGDARRGGDALARGSGCLARICEYLI